MSEHVQIVTERGVARLTLDRPDKRNALRREMLEVMLREVQRLVGDDSLRVLVLQATGKVFCAGMDLGQMQDRAQSNHAKQQWKQDSQIYADLLVAIHALPVPTIAVVQGPVLAGGMGLVLACDIVIAGEDAYFMLPEPMRGITAAMVTPFLVHRVGAGPATYLLLSNEKITAIESRRFGLCHDVVAVDQLAHRVDALIASILTGSPAALAITKQHLADCTAYDLRELVHQSIEVSAQARETDDAREGLAAFLEKRKPSWQTGG